MGHEVHLRKTSIIFITSEILNQTSGKAMDNKNMLKHHNTIEAWLSFIEKKRLCKSPVSSRIWMNLETSMSKLQRKQTHRWEKIFILRGICFGTARKLLKARCCSFERMDDNHVSGWSLLVQGMTVRPTSSGHSGSFSHDSPVSQNVHLSGMKFVGSLYALVYAEYFFGKKKCVCWMP